MAVRHGESGLSYSQLAGRARAFAVHLQQLGIGEGARVAVVAPKSLHALVAIVGSSLAGCTYVPCDASLPTERLCRVLFDCRASALVTTPAVLERLRRCDPALMARLKPIFTIEPCEIEGVTAHDFALEMQEAALPRVDPSTSAYILYTSGSTGTPKGVVHSHGSAQSFVDWSIKAFDVKTSSRLTNHAKWSFDLSVFDLWAALSAGAQVTLVPAELALRPQEYVGKLRDWRITHFYAVPSTIALLQVGGALAGDPLPELTHLLYAGEPFPISSLRNAMHCLAGTRFFNLFGPTETNVCVYYALPRVLDEHWTQVPIGVPCEHLTVELLDDTGAPVATLEEGEICVAGPSVLTEYFGHQEETVRSFHPGGKFADGRARFRTGDRAHADTKGLLWFHGRRDRMVKRRGYRIELGEIEAAITQSSDVAECAAVAHGQAGEILIKLVVVLRQGCTTSAFHLRAFCAAHLPAYMVPDHIEILSALPRTSNEKVDLQGLARSSGV